MLLLLNRHVIRLKFWADGKPGLHYDLRLQISQSSSISFAIMYGLPGNPNSKRLNRNATETRVHNLWVCTVGLLFVYTLGYSVCACQKYW